MSGTTILNELTDAIDKERPLLKEAIILLEKAKLSSSTWSIRVNETLRKQLVELMAHFSQNTIG
jgi:hypothetical protein